MLNLEDQRISSWPDGCSKNTSSFLGFRGTPKSTRKEADSMTGLNITTVWNLVGKLPTWNLFFSFLGWKVKWHHQSWTDTNFKMRHDFTTIHLIHAVGQQHHLSTVTGCDISWPEWCVLVAALLSNDTHSFHLGMWDGVHNVSLSFANTKYTSANTYVHVKFICIITLHIQPFRLSWWGHVQ